MFNKLKLILENNDLKKENKCLYEENKQYREDITVLELQKCYSNQLANKTLDYLNNLQEIDKLGIAEKSKKQRRNAIINELRQKNIDIIKN